MSQIGGIIVRNTGSHYLALCEDGVERLCLAKGNFRLKGIRSTNPIAVGDRVSILLHTDTQVSDVHFITEILPRKNYILRKAANLSKQSHILAANVDASFLICTLVAPATSTTFIDRFLANAEAYRVPTELIFNKIDMLTNEGLEYLNELTALYEGIGYVCHQVSALTGEGLGGLSERMHNKVTLFSGHSGVGKSTLINALIPGTNLKTGDISQAHYTGTHTTTFSQMIPLPTSSGYLIDTPGIKGFGLLDVERQEISHYFREIFALQPECRFGNCTHTHEPSCAVRTALEEGAIAQSRYISYLSIIEDNEEENKYRPEY